MAITPQQQIMLQGLGGLAAGGMGPEMGGLPGQGGLPLQAGIPGQGQIDPMVLASALTQGQPPVNPAPVDINRPADVLAGQGSMLDYLRQMRQWKAQGMVGPQPVPPGMEAPQPAAGTPGI